MRLRSDDLQRRRRRLVEPELAVRLVGRDHEVVPRGELGELLVERERCDRARRVVRIVHPDDRRALPRRRVDRVELREERRARAAAAASPPRRRRTGRRARTPDTPARRTRRAACRRADRRAPARARRSPPSTRSVGTISVSGSTVTPKRRPHQSATARRSSGNPCASGYGDRSGNAATSASRMIGSVGSFGSPLPKSITSHALARAAAAAPPRGGRTDTSPCRRAWERSGPAWPRPYRAGSSGASRSSARDSRSGPARRACARTRSRRGRS